MTAKYLLPCSCGKKIPVSTSQAGQEVQCACGVTNEVPTMLGLRKLEPAAEPPTPSRGSAAWGLRQQIALVGVLVILSALAGAKAFHSNQPTRRSIDELTIIDTWLGWDEFKTPVDEYYSWELGYYELRDKYHGRMKAMLLLAVLGVVMVGSSLLIPKKPMAGPPGRS